MKSKLLAFAAAAALAVPAAAIATPGHGHRHGPHAKHAKGNPAVAYVFKGTYNGDSSVHVVKGNSRVRKGGFVDQDVQFDLGDARLTVADTNADGTVDATDLVVGDKLVVKARLPKQDPGAQPFAARHVVDQTSLAPAEVE